MGMGYSAAGAACGAQQWVHGTRQPNGTGRETKWVLAGHEWERVMLQQNKGCRWAAGGLRWPAWSRQFWAGCTRHDVAGTHLYKPAAPLRCVLLCMLRSSGNPAVHCRHRQVDDVAVNLLKRHCTDGDKGRGWGHQRVRASADRH